MRNLLKADLYRIFHDKAIYVGSIIIAIFEFLTAILFLIIKISASSMIENPVAAEELRNQFSFVALLASSTSFTGNMGLVIFIISIVFLTREFSFGTIRNKVISGHSKTKIYLSTSITSIIIGSGLYIVNLFTSIIFGLIFLGTGIITSTTLSQVCVGLLFAILLSFFFSLLACFYSMVIKTSGLSIVAYVASVLVIAGLSKVYELSSSFPKWVFTLCEFNPIYQINLVASAMSDFSLYTQEIVLIMSFSLVFYIAFITIIGALIFRKCDLK